MIEMKAESNIGTLRERVAEVSVIISGTYRDVMIHVLPIVQGVCSKDVYMYIHVG